MASKYDWWEIDRLREAGQTWAEIADLYDVAASTLRGAYSRRQNDSTSPGASVPPAEEEGDPLAVIEKSGVSRTRITSLEELFIFFDIPFRMVESATPGEPAIPYSDEYEVLAFRVNSWEQHSVKKGVTTLYQVRASLRPRRQAESFTAAREAVKAMLEEVATHAPAFAYEATGDWNPTGDDPVLFELAAFDPHIGMLAWGEEVGRSYDSTIAIEDYGNAIEYLLRFADMYPVEKILYVVGNDFLHVDGPSFDSKGTGRGGATTAGTAQDVDTRLAKMFTAGRQALIQGIDTARNYCAMVDVLVVPGNHDEQQMYRMAEVLSAWYRNTDGVTVLYGPNRRKYYQYGKNLIGFTHGMEFKRKRDNLALIMPTEAPPEMWAETTHREWHVGHNHIKQELEYMAPVQTQYETRAIRVRSLPGLTSEDSWHHQQGYKHRRAATAIAFRESGGVVGVHEFNLD